MLLGWVSHSRISDFRSSHVAIAEETTGSVNEAIARFISEHRRFVSVFTVTHRDLLAALIANPDDADFHAVLIEKLKLFFPEHFAYSLANKSGEPLFEYFDGMIGVQCLQDLQKFSNNSVHLPRVHPNAETYHC